MTLTLTIENLTTLPDGGPLSVSIKGKRGLDIGRDQYLDWTLPDPSRFISGKHCEVRWHDGGYWLHDISANGTFLQGDDNRLKEPHRLRDGDRFAVGHYIIAVILSDDIVVGETGTPIGGLATNYEELWSPIGETAPPIDPKELRASGDLRPVKPDFLSWAIDVPPAHNPVEPHFQRNAKRWEDSGIGAAPVETWSEGPPKLPPAEPSSNPHPSPRRPVWVANEPEGQWAAAVPAPARSPLSPDKLPSPLGPTSSASHPQRADDRGVPASRTTDPIEMDIVRLFARGAGLEDDAFGVRDPAQLAEQLGQLMRLVLENMKQLLEARQQAKRLARSSNQTMVQALNNNPLKYAPTIEEAMRIMFGPKTRSYLDARETLAQSFDDVKKHQVKTYAAMQHALKLVLAQLDPAIIEAESKGDSGFAGLLSSRNARHWEVYVARWQARTQHHEDGMLNAFMDYFAEFYDREGNK